MGKVRDLVGFRSGRLVAVRFAGLQGRKRKHAAWICACECGREVTVANGSLTSGNTRSCGCLKVESIRSPKTHGGASGGKSNEYMIWKSMRQRCQNQNDPQYYLYGGRGISVCDRWSDFAAFRDDMGQRPSRRHSLDRVNNDGNYEPGNVRWATIGEQASNTRRNRRITHLGRTQTMAQWCRELNINYQTVAWRIYGGASTEDALAPTPSGYVDHSKRARLEGQRGTI